MPRDESPPGGVLQALHRLGDAGLALLQNRLELFGIEFEEQKARLVKTLLLTAVLGFFGNMAGIVITVTIVDLAGERGRIVALLAFCAFYLVATVVAFLLLRRDLRSAPPPFQETLSELKKDRDCLKSPK